MGGITTTIYSRAAVTIAELIVVLGAVTNSTRQLLEGYLAWKWFGSGSAVLPSSHPYYGSSPVIAPGLSGFLNIETPLFALTGANMNVTTDQQFTLRSGLTGQFSTYDITRIRVTFVSGAALTTAAGGIYTAASKGGTVLVAATQTFATLTGTGLAMELALTPAGMVTQSGQTPFYLSLTTPQGAAATVNVVVYGIPRS
jgi:hypothetical protein